MLIASALITMLRIGVSLSGALLLDHHGRGAVEVRVLSIVVISGPRPPGGCSGGGQGGVASEPSLGSEFHSLLLLPLVAEPHPHHVFLEVKLLCDGRNLFAGGPRLHCKIGLQ